MDSQGEKIIPDGANSQAPFDGMPSTQPSQDINAPQNDASTSDNNVAQHILGGINGSSSQPANTSNFSTESVPAEPPTEPFGTPPTTMISSADVVEPEMLPESSTGEAARIHAALSHPYFSNHPTQTAASGVGDIIIDNQPSSKPRRLPRVAIFGLIGLAVVLLISGLAIVLSMSGGGSGSLATELESYRNAVAGVEENFYRASQNLIPFEETLADEFANNFNKNLVNTIKLQEKLNKREQGSLGNDVWTQLTEVRDTLNTRIPMWQASLDFYSQVRDAYKQGNNEYFDELQNSDNNKVADVGWTFYSYFWFDQYWQDALSDSGCNNPTNSTSCIAIRESQEEATSNLLSNAPVVMSMFSAYDNTLYTNDSLVYKKIDRIIEETR